MDEREDDVTAARQFLRPMVTFAPGPKRRLVALRAAVAAALPLVGISLLGNPEHAFMAGLGVFAVLYGASGPVRRRFRTIPLAGAGLLLAICLGILSSGYPTLAIVVMAFVATVAALLTYSLGIGPPAAFFFALDVGIANLAATGGAPPTMLLGYAAVGVLSAIVVGTSDAWLGVTGIEEDAVSSAEDLVGAYVAEEDPDRIPRARRTAASALNRAWTAVTDGGTEEAFEGRLQRLNNRYSSRVARAVGSPDSDVTAEMALVETARVRQISLGRPRATWSLRQALRWPSEDLLVAVRVLLATLIAGGIAILLDNAHAYWAAAFAVLVVQTGGTRVSQLQRALHRTVGTAAGLLVFAVILKLDPGHWWLVLLIPCFQGAVELLVTRNYTVAVTFITPLALMIASRLTQMDTETIIADRALDTVIGVGVAVLVLVVSGRLGRPELLLRAHARRVVLALADVLDDLADRRTRTEAEMAAHLDHCRQLYVELIGSDVVANRAHADAPGAVAPYREMEQLLADIGYLVLGATWHPQVRGQRERMAAARTELAALVGHPVGRKRPAADITRDLRRVEAALMDG